MSDARPPQVTVVGGGVAGLAAALRLQQMGCDVQLLEAATALGGKAGSRLIDGRWEDHGYHVAFPWYLNFLDILRELGVQDRWVVNDGYHHVFPGEWPRLRTLKAGYGLRNFYEDIRSGLMSTPDRLLFHYTILDVLSRDFSPDGGLPDTSIDAFLASRWYCTSALREEIYQLVLTGQGIRTSDASMRTWRTVFASFTRHGIPLSYMPAGTLQETLIGPWHDRLIELGATIRTEWRVTAVESDGGRAAEIVVDTPQGQVRQPVDQLVIALPPEALLALKGDATIDAGLATGKLRQLRSRPLAALHLYLDRDLAELPRDHLRLAGSPHAISLLDIAKSQEEHTKTCLNLVLGNPAELLQKPADEVTAEVVREVAAYLPEVSEDRIEHACWQPNVDAPFVNDDVNCWDVRPEVTTALPNVFAAADFVRSHVDVSCMEGATVTGLLAADALRRRTGISAAAVEVRRPKPISVAPMRVLRVALAPVAYGAARLFALRRNRKGP